MLEATELQRLLRSIKNDSGDLKGTQGPSPIMNNLFIELEKFLFWGEAKVNIQHHQQRNHVIAHQAENR